jgi:hypothetical protein
MRTRHVLAALVTMLAVLVSTSSPGEAARRSYSVTTSTPEGRAVCTFTGSVENAKNKKLRLRLEPAAGDEATVTLVPLILGADNLDVAAGIENACDIFVNNPVQASMTIKRNVTNFLGVVQIHAHPGLDCNSPKLGTGDVVLKIKDPGNDDTLTVSQLTCSGNAAEANLAAFMTGANRLLRGERHRFSALIRNLGPGNATQGRFRVRIPKGLLLDFGTHSTTHGACRLEVVGGGAFSAELPCPDEDESCLEPLGAELVANDFICDLDDRPVHDPLTPGADDAVVEFDLIPAAKEGLQTTTYRTNAANSGDLIPPIALGTQVQQGLSAILRVKVKAKAGSGGTVAISPPTPATNCTAPAPQNPAALNTQCIEVYNTQTTVDLTVTVNSGQFAGWEDDCAGFGTALTCTLVLDPNELPNPDKNAKAKFKP